MWEGAQVAARDVAERARGLELGERARHLAQRARGSY
jgi:hypothetical protein